MARRPAARARSKTAKSAPPIHERVKAHVHNADITQAQLAVLTGWDEQRVYRVLNGKTKLNVEDMELLASILDRPVTSLYDVVEKKAS